MGSDTRSMRIGCDEGGTKGVRVALSGIQMPGLTRARQGKTGDNTGHVLVCHAGPIEALACRINHG
jgi:hypothetical protein